MDNKEQLYDLTAFRELDKYDPGALKKIVSVFLDTTPEIVAELNNACKVNRLDNAAQLAHKLKATIDVLSIKPLTKVIRDIEQIARSGDNLEKLPGQLELLNVTFEEIILKIKQEIT